MVINLFANVINWDVVEENAEEIAAIFEKPTRPSDEDLLDGKSFKCNNCESFDTDIEPRFSVTDYLRVTVTCAECGWVHVAHVTRP